VQIERLHPPSFFNLFEVAMDLFSYLTIDHPATGLYKEKGSKFLAFALPVESEDQVRLHLENLRKEYFDARHHCFAWMLGAERNHFRAFDDGEPNHSAGDPILGQIRSRNLTNVLVVVVRYFGGTKLGVGGLISAYKQSAEDALNKAIIVERELTEIVQLEFEYNATPEVMRLVKEFSLTVLEQQFELNCFIVLKVPMRLGSKLTEKLTLLQATGSKLVFSKKK
jgi:uncharacterized YigZ family protein